MLLNRIERQRRQFLAVKASFLYLLLHFSHLSIYVHAIPIASPLFLHRYDRQ